MIDRNRTTETTWRVGNGAVLLLLAVVWLAGGSGCGTPPDPASTTTPAAASKSLQRGSAEPIPVRRAAVSLGERREYLGSRACVRCHRREAGQVHSHHARTLWKVSAASDGWRFQQPGEVRDPRLDVSYRTAVDGAECVLWAKQGENSARVRARYAFGSGNRGVTYVGTYNSRPVELRVSYYHAGRRWALTPGQQGRGRPDTPVGRILDRETEEGCYLCHSTALVRESDRLLPESSIFGIGCESCHGPGRRHVDAVRRHEPGLQMAHLADFKAQLSTQLCGQCHRSPGVVDLTDPVTLAQLPRFQGAALGLSKCFKGSGGQLACVSCHDPHANASQVSRADYNRKCVGCHQVRSNPQRGCPVQPRGDCVSCHMPLQTVDIPTRPTFRNHWIKVWPSANADAPRASHRRAE